MEIKAVIFDRDGVLTRFAITEAVAFFQPLLPLSLEEIGEQWTQWGTNVGFPRDAIEEKRFFQTFWQMLSEKFRLSDGAKEQLLQVDYTKFLRAFPDARQALLDARQLKLRTAVLSNFSLASLETSLAAVNLADLIDSACAATVIGAAKPTRAAYEIVSRAIDVLPEECLFFDDEQACVEGARLAGMHAFLVDRRHSTHYLEENIVCDLLAIPKILAQLALFD